MSTAIRYTTLPGNPGPPLTMTLTISPLMGHLSTTYAIKAGPNAAFCSRLDFNIYSYESDLVVGCELWKKRTEQDNTTTTVTPSSALLAQGQDMVELNPTTNKNDDVTGVFKARWTQSLGLGLLWEGRVKHLLLSLGANIDFRRREGIIKGVGVEVQYSS